MVPNVAIAAVVFVLQLQWLCVSASRQFQFSFNPGPDSSTTDTYGTEFVFPEPYCPPLTFFKVQLVRRGVYPTVVWLLHPLKPAMSDRQITGNNYFGDLRAEDSSTIFMECGLFERKAEIASGVVVVKSTREILVHVMVGDDSYSVLPVNVLGRDYTILSVTTVHTHRFFITVVAQQSTNITITPGGKGTAVRHTMGDVSRFVYNSSVSLTGTRVSATGPVFVLSGCWENDTDLVEHVWPDNALGRHHVLPVPFHSHLSVAAYDGGVEMDYNPHYLSQVMAADQQDEKVAVMVDSSAPFTLLFLMTSSQQHLRLENERQISYRLRSLLSVAPVDIYLGQPCYSSQLNLEFAVTVVAGVEKKGADSDSVAALASTRRHRLDQFWVRTLAGNAKPMGSLLSKVSKAQLPRLWFHESYVVRRHRTLYFLDGASHVHAPSSTCRSITAIADDSVDNDCDGLVDEELSNQIDDDGDGRTDEDTTARDDYVCPKLETDFMWEPSRYRITRFEANYYEFATRLPQGYVTKVFISAMVGISMVFVFIFFIWFLDFLRFRMDPYAQFKMF